MKALMFASLIMCSTLSFANDMFVIKKNKNPKNQLHYKANIESCMLKSNAVTAYWVMGEEDGHIESLTSLEKPMFQPKMSYNKDSEADFAIGAMDKLGNKLPNKKISVRLENCKPHAFIEIKGQEIELKEINAQMGTFSVQSITISGIAPNGAKVSHKFEN